MRHVLSIFQSICLSILVLLSVFSVVGTTQAYAYVNTNWSCGPYRVWSPGDGSWFHIQSCIREDISGKMYAQARVWHSSGPTYNGPCYTRVYLEDHSWSNRRVVIGPLKGINCATSGTETIYANPPDLVRGHWYIANAFMQGSVWWNVSDYTYSHYLEYK